MKNHVHISALWFISVGAAVILWEFFIHMAAGALAKSSSENKQLFGAALGNLA